MSGVPILSGCGFCCWRGVAIWAWGIWGFPGGGFLGGFAGAGAAAWPVWGIGDSWVLFFWRLHAALLGSCAGGRRWPAWRPYCSGVVRGGLGVLGALCSGLGVDGWAWGGPAWVLVGVRRKHGLVHALGPGSGVGVFDASVPPQGGGGPIEAG